MHIPDGFIDAPTAAAYGVASAALVGIAIVKTRDTLEEKEAPLAGLTAAFIFAVQMINFPVASGTSGHLLGGLLAAVLVGPWTGALCVTLVILVQGLLFADGGLTALGLNVFNMAFVTALGGYAVFLVCRRVLPRSKSGVVTSAAIAAWCSVVLASLSFTIEFAIGGTAPISVSAVFAAMVGTHALIGIGEAVITALTVSAVLAVRPDLVYGARDLTPSLEVRADPGVT